MKMTPKTKPRIEVAGADRYQDWHRSQVEKAIQSDPLLALCGSGKELWAGERADEYVARLRAGWQ
jgi:hypothetical protein